ncbi:MAG: hypothetical protein ACR2HX_23560 [Pyrinomonadaceae bacterium]
MTKRGAGPPQAKAPTGRRTPRSSANLRSIYLRPAFTAVRVGASVSLPRSSICADDGPTKDSTRVSTADDDDGLAGADVCASPKTTLRQTTDRTAIAEQRFRMAFQRSTAAVAGSSPDGGR